MKKIYLVKLTEGDGTTLEGHRGNREYLFDCLALEVKDGQHNFVHAFHTDSVPSEHVESCRELGRVEAFEMVYGKKMSPMPRSETAPVSRQPPGRSLPTWASCVRWNWSPVVGRSRHPQNCSIERTCKREPDRGTVIGSRCFMKFLFHVPRKPRSPVTWASRQCNPQGLKRGLLGMWIFPCLDLGIGSQESRAPVTQAQLSQDSQRAGDDSPVTVCPSEPPTQRHHGSLGSCLVRSNPVVTQGPCTRTAPAGRSAILSSASARQYDVRPPTTGIGSRLNLGRGWEVAETFSVGSGSLEAPNDYIDVPVPGRQPRRASGHHPGCMAIGAYSGGRTRMLTTFFWGPSA